MHYLVLPKASNSIDKDRSSSEIKYEIMYLNYYFIVELDYAKLMFNI